MQKRRLRDQLWCLGTASLTQKLCLEPFQWRGHNSFTTDNLFSAICLVAISHRNASMERNGTGRWLIYFLKLALVNLSQMPRKRARLAKKKKKKMGSVGSKEALHPAAIPSDGESPFQGLSPEILAEILQVRELGFREKRKEDRSAPVWFIFYQFVVVRGVPEDNKVCFE